MGVFMILDKKMQIFLTVAETGGFSLAARQLSLSQSVVSFHVDALEKELGVTLFNRQGRTISLTEEGVHLFREGKKISCSARPLEEDISSLTGHITNRIFLGGDALTCVFTLPWTLAAYREKNPDVVFAYKHLNHDELQEKLISGDIDLALSGHPIRHRKLVSHSCFSDEIILVTGKDNNLDKVGIKELSTIPLIWATGDRGLEILLTQKLTKAGAHVTNLNIFMEAEDIAILKNFIRAGVGSAFLPRVAVQDELRLKLLSEVPVENLTILRNTYLVHSKGKQMRDTVKGFMDFVQDQNWAEEQER